MQPLILRDLCKKASCDPLQHSAGHSVVLRVHVGAGDIGVGDIGAGELSAGASRGLVRAGY